MFMGAGPGPLGPSRNDEDHFRQRAWDVTHYVYLLASRRHGTLYLGVTNDLVRPRYTARRRLRRARSWRSSAAEPE